MANFYLTDLPITIDRVRYELKLAWKYFRARRRSLARFTAVVAVLGIAAGVAAMIVAQAISRGFADEMRDKILAHTAHVAVFRQDAEQIRNWETLGAELSKIENVREVSATTYESALIVGPKSANYCVLRAVSVLGTQMSSTASQIEGFQSGNQTGGRNQNENARTPDNNASASKFETSDLKFGTISLGAELAEKAGLRVGDEAEIIFPNGGFAPQASRVTVNEIFRTGLYDYDSTWIYVSFADLARLAGKSDFAPTVLSVSVRDVFAADKTAGALRETLGRDFKVIDWQSANRPLFAALGLERQVSLAIISLITFVAVLNITTTLALLVNERKLDIAVLRTCGAPTRSLILIFLIEGLLLGVAGITAGLFIGLTLCAAGNSFEIISLPAQIYSLQYVPLRPRALDVGLIVLAAFVLSLAATVYPAYRASRVKPLENLRSR